MPRCARALQLIAAVLTCLAIIAEYFLSDRTMTVVLASFGLFGCSALHYGLSHAHIAIRRQSLADFITIAAATDDPLAGR
jgi:hypothetical protein